MIRYLKKVKFFTTLGFVVSPVFSLPIILTGVYNKSKFHLYFFIFFVAYLSFLYIPHIENDRARYFEFYYAFKEFNFNYFLLFIAQGRPDFILHLLIFIFAKINLPIQGLLMLVTGFTVSVFYWLLFKISKIEGFSNPKFYLTILLVFFSFSLTDLISGIRFYFGVSFGALGLYYGLKSPKEFKKSILFFAIGTLTHFSVLFFLVLYFLFYFIPKKNSIFNIIFAVSILFLFIPKDFLYQIVSIIVFTPGHQQKIQIYLENEDFLKKGLETGSANFIYIVISNFLWILVAYIYLFMTYTRESVIRYFTIFYLSCTNLFFSIPNVFSRYMLFGKFLFLFLLLYEHRKHKNFAFILVLFGSFFLNFLISLILIRNNIFTSFFKFDSLFFITGIMDKIEVSDFLK